MIFASSSTGKHTICSLVMDFCLTMRAPEEVRTQFYLYGFFCIPVSDMICGAALN